MSIDRRHRRGRHRVIALTTAAIAALAVSPGPAAAAATPTNVAGELVSGTTAGMLALTGTAATFTTNFGPGGTATANGLLTATNTAASSTLTVADAATSGTGHMVAAATACANSDAQLTEALTTQVTGPAGTSTSGRKDIPAYSAPVTVLTASKPLATTQLTTAYSQTIPASQVMLTGCVYSLTATYTLQ